MYKPYQSNHGELDVNGLTKIDLNLDTLAGGEDKMPLWAKLGKLLTMKPIRTIMKLEIKTFGLQLEL